MRSTARSKENEKLKSQNQAPGSLRMGGKMRSRVAQGSVKCQWRAVCYLSPAMGELAKEALAGMCLKLP